MSIEEAFAKPEAEHRDRVLSGTWGHLAPRAGRKYRGTILYCHGCYRQIVAISVDLEGLSDSPWFYDHLQDFLFENRGEPGTVSLFRGYYRTDEACEEYEFCGSIEEV